MLTIEQVEIAHRTLDFSPSDQGRVSVRSVLSESITLINAIELIAPQADALQLIVCEECGVTGCRMGGWACLRRLGADVVQLPAFSRMEDGATEEAAPPEYMATHGIVRYRPSAYTQMREAGCALPDSHELPSLRASEAVRVLQWEAPMRILGRFPAAPDPELPLLVAVSHGSLETERHALRETLLRFFHSAAPVSLQRPASTRSFYVEGPGYPEWCPMSVSNTGERMLHLGNGIDLAA